jgi:phosphatidylserine/phosphatidylglycerophosphate/cardiolipin synthase-like enzyme
MDDIWAIIAELGIDLHPDRIAVIAAKVEKLHSAADFPLAKSSFGPNADQDQINRFQIAWSAEGDMQPSALAAALRAASSTSAMMEERSSIELVWTGPSTGLVSVRHTEQVLREVIQSARRRLFLVSFVAYEVDAIIRALRDAVGRQVRIDVLLESSTAHGGKVTTDSVKAMRKSIPSANIYIWNGDGEKGVEGKHMGAVHAKCAVADGDLAFITSANLTTAAMERNMELGVLLKGGRVPDELIRHLDALVMTGVVELV